jgi:hypothetical protein
MIVVVAAIAAALGGAAYAWSTGGPNAQVANQDRVFGGGTFAGCSTDGAVCIPNTRSFSIDAHASSSDHAAYGDMWYGAPGGNDQHAQITCIATDAGKAVVAGVVDQATRPAILGDRVLVFFDDRGTPAAGGDESSLLDLTAPGDVRQPAGFPYVCPSPDNGAPYTSTPPSFFRLDGDVSVHDADHPPVSSTTQVVVTRGQPLQIALANDRNVPFGAGIANAVQMAVEAHPSVRGFPVQVRETRAPCGDPAADVAAAQTIVADLQNAGVLGQPCSSGFDQALAVYESARVVTISGSASAPALPQFGSTSFDRTIVSDPGSDAWYAAVSQLPGDLAWRQAYTLRFGTAPTDFADLYYDAAGLLIQDVASVATIDGGSLVVGRAALAHAVRTTSGYQGVTCTVTIDPATGNRVNDLSPCAH